MSSSTSNSRIAWKSIFLGALMVGAYGALVKSGRVPKGDGISQDQANAIKLQRYLYDKDLNVRAVLVGSSLGANLKVERIDPSFYNLAILGGSSQTGLELVVRSKLQPKVVFIEVGPYFGRGLDKETIEGLTSPSASWLANSMPFTMQEYHPVNAALSVLKRRKQKDADGPEATESAKAAAMAHWQDEYGRGLTSDELKKLMREIDWTKDKIQELEERGMKVVLVDIPLEPTIEKTQWITEAKNLVQSEFPSEQYTWYELPKGVAWRTGDGLHLVPSQAKLFAASLVEFVNSVAK